MSIRDLINRIKDSRLARGFFITTIGSGISKIVLVVATFCCSNLLGKSEFGELSFVRNTLNMVLCICALNFTALCTKFTTEAKLSIASFHRLFLLFCFSFCVCLLFGCLLLLSPEWLLLRLFSTERIVQYIKIAGCLLPLFMLQPLIEGLLRGVKQFGLIGALQIVSSVFYLIVVIVGIRVRGLNGALFGVIAYYAFYAIISLLVLIKKYPLEHYTQRFKGARAQIPSIKALILPVFFMSFIDAPAMWFAQVILAKSDSFGSVGGMSAMMQIRNLAMLIPAYFSNTYIAFAGELNAQKKYGEYYQQYRRIGLSYLVVGVVLFFFLSCLSKPVLFLYGKDFVSDWPAMIISNLCIPLTMLIGLYRVDLVLKEHQSSLLYISIIWNTIWLVSLYLLIRAGVSPLYSFFVSQNIGAVVFLVSIYSIYRSDQRRLLNEGV